MSATKTFFAGLSASDFHFIRNFNAPYGDVFTPKFALPALTTPPYYFCNDQVGKA